MKKPSKKTILGALPLSRALARPLDPISACNVCGRPSNALGAWREHDERDEPILGPGALVFIAADHLVCLRVMGDHPRLYAEEMGDPGHFPRLCGSCRFRSGLACTHPKLKANGGPGLLVKPDRASFIACTRGRGGGCHQDHPAPHAIRCEGRESEPVRAGSEPPPAPPAHPQEAS